MTKLGFSLSNLMTTPTFIFTIGTTLVVAISILIVFTNYLRSSSKKKAKLEQNKDYHHRPREGEEKIAAATDTLPDSGHQQPQQHQPTTKNNRSKSKTQQRLSKVAYTHPWILTTLKAHGGPVLDLDFSSNKKYLASCAEDRTVMLWTIKDFTQKDHKTVRVNVEFDYAQKVKWSPDSKAFIICRASNNDLEVFRVNKKPDGSSGLGGAQVAHAFPTKHKDDIVGMGIASTGKFIMTCSANTNLVIWNLKGETLTSLDTHQVNTYYACVSHCGRFVASCGFTSDVKVWQVVFNKSGEFKDVCRAFELKGHSAGVESFAFNDDSSRMASVSKDKTWKLWDTKVEFEKGQEPYLLLTNPCKLQGPAKIALSPDGRVVAIATWSLVHIYSGITGNEEKVIDNEALVTCITFDPYGKWLLAAVDKHIRVFHNVVGYRATIQDLEERRKLATNQSMRERIQQQITEARSCLQTIGNI